MVLGPIGRQKRAVCQFANLWVNPVGWLALSYDSWLWWKLRLLELCMLLLLLALYLEVRVLVECYREYRENKRENEQYPGESYQPPAQFDESPSGNLCQLRRSNGNLGLTKADGGCRDILVS